MIGTPPGPNACGEIFTKTRSIGLEGTDARLCWHEWSCPDGVDLDDPACVAQSNPAAGIRLDWDTISDKCAVMDDEGYGRERLGVWGTAAVHRVISAQAWSRCAEPNLVDSRGEVAIAIDVGPDRSVSTLCAAGRTVDGKPFLDVVASRRGEPEWCVHRAAEMWKAHDVRAVVVDGASAAASLGDPLRRSDVTVTVTSARQMAAACGNLFDAVMAGAVRHLDQPVLNTALSVARSATVGGDGRARTPRVTSRRSRRPRWRCGAWSPRRWHRSPGSAADGRRSYRAGRGGVPPQVRLIVDPLRQLTPIESGAMTFSGVHT